MSTADTMLLIGGLSASSSITLRARARTTSTTRMTINKLTMYTLYHILQERQGNRLTYWGSVLQWISRL